MHYVWKATHTFIISEEVSYSYCKFKQWLFNFTFPWNQFYEIFSEIHRIMAW